jgi:hypothetical protein
MFQDIAIGIKTFLRDEQLFNTIHAVKTNLPGAQLIIADCGDHTEEKDGVYADLEREGHKTIQLPFDSGFGVMSCAIAAALDRDYLLVGSDDFDFSTQEVRQGIAKLKEVLDLCPEVDIASGRVNGNPYEFDLIDEDGRVTEIPLDYIDLHNKKFLWFVHADLTVNYSLIRRSVFWTPVFGVFDEKGHQGNGAMRSKIGWDADVKIGGGEHGAFFLDCKRAGFKTVYVPGVNINEQKVRNSERYRQFRNRARSPERPCFVRRGIHTYILGDGRVDYQEKS